MNNAVSHGTSGRSLAHDGEENMSMFFDFEPSGQEARSFQPPTQTPETATRGGIRVSLACIPCRSRHVKCGAEMPNCSRCQQDDKPCFYAKSRRGMRDRNAPRKKAAQGGKFSPVLDHQLASSHNAMGYTLGPPSSDAYPGLPSSGSASSSSSLPRPASPRRLIDLYYNFFYKAHPFVLPRYYFFNRLENDPESLKHLRVVMQYIGSLYAPDVSSAEYRESALSLLNLSNMPPNGFTVQTLLMIALALHCDNEMERGREVLDRAIYLALELRMNFQEFANMEQDPVLAESWRRTYWGLYISDSTFAGIKRAPTFILHTIDVSVQLPCEECEYLSGVIPPPRTLAEYEARDFEDETPVFSSFSYLIDLTRIVGCLLNIDSLSIKEREVAVANSDARLVNWKLHLPPEKQGIIDKNEQVDEMLFRCHFLINVLLIFIHRPLSRLAHSPIERMSLWAPPAFPPGHLENDQRAIWLHTRKTLQAAESAIDLLALPCSLLSHSPHVSSGITISLLACVSACCYVITGKEWERMRDRIRLGLGALKVWGALWGMARRAEREAKKVARCVFNGPREEMVTAKMGGDLYFAESNPTTNLDRLLDWNSSSTTDTMAGSNLGWHEADYLSLLESMGQPDYNGST